jgi:hypothetical protein
MRTDDWDEIRYGYLNLQTVPDGAMISLKVTGTFDALIKPRFKSEVKTSSTESSEWAVIGSSPLLNHELALACDGVQHKNGTRVRVWYSVDKISVRVEKEGYGTVTLDNVALNAKKDDPNKLVVELVPDR